MAEAEALAGGSFVRIEPGEAAALLSRGEAVMLDVRGLDEFAVERIPGALLAPMTELRAEGLPAEGPKRVILQCRSGARTYRLAEALIGAGIYGEVAHLEGGILAWKAAGLPTIRPDPSREVT